MSQLQCFLQSYFNILATYTYNFNKKHCVLIEIQHFIAYFMYPSKMTKIWPFLALKMLNNYLFWNRVTSKLHATERSKISCPEQEIDLFICVSSCLFAPNLNFGNLFALLFCFVIFLFGSVSVLRPTESTVLYQIQTGSSIGCRIECSF